ncbi:hypothetical protein [Lonsdalea populi]|uniref:hypothetical protein n=1 Tax=Lonsdalea populi TaxID=1172565 RepID=UPI0015EC9391|nr:hypothetical protein [Lonsdalea populi]
MAEWLHLPCAGADRQPNGAVCAKAPCCRSASPYADRYCPDDSIRGRLHSIFHPFHSDLFPPASMWRCSFFVFPGNRVFGSFYFFTTLYCPGYSLSLTAPLSLPFPASRERKPEILFSLSLREHR